LSQSLERRLVLNIEASETPSRAHSILC